MNLTEGTLITIPQKEIQSQLLAIGFNEISSDSSIKADGQVVIVSRSWMIERDEREMRLLQTIEELKIK